MTTELPNGELLYALGVAPSNAYNSYRNVFNRIIVVDHASNLELRTQNLELEGTRTRIPFEACASAAGS